jgi:hypothetical protein
VRFVQREGSRLVKVQTVGLAAFGPINPHTAVPAHAAAAFGEPSSVDLDQDLCRQRWPELGLAIWFATPDGGDPCAAEAGIETIRLRGEAAAEAGWRTAEGIRPGMSVAAARRIYPEAEREQSGMLVLVELLEEIESGGDPVLAVTTARGKVKTLTFPIGVE